MRIETLPSPGLLSNSIGLRSAAAQAISKIEIVAGRSAGGKTSGANALYTFFTACATAVSSLRDVTAPTVVSITQPVGGKTITITLSEGVRPDIIPALASFVTSPGRTITGIEVVGNTVLVTYAGASLANGNTIAYTAPGTNDLQDAGGNILATFAASAITVA